MSPHRNIELKARCRELRHARKVFLEMGAREAGVLIQTDTYFRVPNGRLKLREIESEHCELIWYDRPNNAESRTSTYFLVRVPDPTGMKLTLTAALGVRGQIRKRRELLLWHNVRIHLDEVDDLGNFVEFEAVMGPGEIEAMGHERLKELSQKLEITAGDCVAFSYSDLARL